jgi:uncharacterized protein (TIGR03435 family)
MTRGAQRFHDFMDRAFTPVRNVPGDHVEAACGRVLDDLQDAADRGSTDTAADFLPARAHGTWARPATVFATVVLAAAIGTAILWPRGDGALYRIVDGTVQASGAIRTSGGGAQLALVDGSRVEMRTQSELTLERADDGLRIRLSSGGIIVHAAQQRTGHLYVQTKDVTVSVVGTVFLVNAGDEGSRVAVIEGEVRVQQGATEKKLRPGEQVTTGPLMTSPPVREAISWSRNAAALVALLQQSAVVPPAVAPPTVAPPPVALQNSTEPREAFEAISVRPSVPLPPPPPALDPARVALMTPCTGTQLQVDPRRFAVSRIPLHGLIALAYGRTCQSPDLLFGGPDWVRVDGYNIEATLPSGSPGYTERQLLNGAAPALQRMLQALLADRFQLVLRREAREMSFYNLVVVAPEGKVKPSAEEQDPAARRPTRGSLTAAGGGPFLSTTGTTMSRFAGMLQMYMGRPVIDRTDLAGLFDLSLSFSGLDPRGLSLTDLRAAQGDQLSARLQEQLGLKLEAARGPVEVLVIERVERPSEN